MKLAFKRAHVKIYPFRTLRMFLPAGDAKSGLSLTALLAQYQVGLTEFCNEFNERSLELYLPGVEVPIVLWRTLDEIDFGFKFPSLAWIISQIFQQTAAEAIYDFENLQFDFSEELGLSVVVKKETPFFSIFMKDLQFFYWAMDCDFDMEEAVYKRVSLSYLFLWDLVWWYAESFGLACYQSANMVLLAIRPFRAYARIDVRLKTFLLRSYGFFFMVGRFKKVFNDFDLSMLQFKYFIYRFYYSMTGRRDVFFRKIYETSNLVLIKRYFILESWNLQILRLVRFLDSLISSKENQLFRKRCIRVLEFKWYFLNYYLKNRRFKDANFSSINS